MSKVIEIDLSKFFANEEARSNRKNSLIKVTKPESVKEMQIVLLIADIISDSLEGYAFKDGNNDLMITNAVKQILETVKGSN